MENSERKEAAQSSPKGGQVFATPLRCVRAWGERAAVIILLLFCPAISAWSLHNYTRSILGSFSNTWQCTGHARMRKAVCERARAVIAALATAGQSAAQGRQGQLSSQTLASQPPARPGLLSTAPFESLEALAEPRRSF